VYRDARLASRSQDKREAGRETSLATTWASNQAARMNEPKPVGGLVRWGILGCGDVTEIKSGPPCANSRERVAGRDAPRCGKSA